MIAWPRAVSTLTGSEVIDVSQWVGYMVLVCSDEQFVCRFCCAFEARVECENVRAWGVMVLLPQFPEDALEFASLRNP